TAPKNRRRAPPKPRSQSSGSCEADDSDQSVLRGRRLHRVSFDRHSQHRGSVRGVAGSPAHDADACLHQIVPWPGLHAKLSQGQVDRMPEGPSETTRRAGQAVIVGEARNSGGQTVRSRLKTPEGYTLTALTAFDATKRVAAGEVK